jgi:MFS family permease
MCYQAALQPRHNSLQPSRNSPTTSCTHLTAPHTPRCPPRQLHCDWQLSAAGESLLSSVVFAGMMAGACVWGSLADWCGRRRTFAAVALLTLTSSGLSAAAPSFWVSAGAHDHWLRWLAGALKALPLPTLHPACG